MFSEISVILKIFELSHIGDIILTSVISDINDIVEISEIGNEVSGFIWILCALFPKKVYFSTLPK